MDFWNETTLEVESVYIEAAPRRLRATWSREAAEDLRYIHNLDAEAVLTDILAEEIDREIDREIIDDIVMAMNIPYVPRNVPRKVWQMEKPNWRKEGF